VCTVKSSNCKKSFSKASVAKRLKINRRTVTRYWGMNAAEYEGQHISRVKLLDEYQEIILYWLTEYPTVSAAQVCDWQKKHYKADYVIIKEKLISIHAPARGATQTFPCRGRLR